MQFKINIMNRVFMFEFISRKKRGKETILGYTNRCTDGKYIIFLDYDNMPLQWIEYELEALQTLFNIGDFYIFQSSKESYHAVCFDKIGVHEYISLLRNSSVDENYFIVPLKHGRKIWVLRFVDKEKQPIRFVKKLEAFRPSYRESSLPHADFIRDRFDIKIVQRNPDMKDKIVLAKYPI